MYINSFPTNNSIIIYKEFVLKKIFYYILGLISGFANGLFGSGGGMIVVPMLEKADIEPQKAHATSLAIILPLSILSSIIYFNFGNFSFMEALKFIPGGIIGAIIGAIFLKKVPNILLKRIFGIIMIIAGVRLFLR